jgi:hypothetical protein
MITGTELMRTDCVPFAALVNCFALVMEYVMLDTPGLLVRFRKALDEIRKKQKP